MSHNNRFCNIQEKGKKFFLLINIKSRYSSFYFIFRPITKEEKDNENNKKSIPTKSLKATRVPGQWHSVDNKDEAYILPQRFTTIRHHLERTTGPGLYTFTIFIIYFFQT